MFNGRNITISINQRELRGWVNPVKPYRENYTSRNCRATCSNKKNFLRGFKAKKKKTTKKTHHTAANQMKTKVFTRQLNIYD